jgi:hypothetical protein
MPVALYTQGSVPSLQSADIASIGQTVGITNEVQRYPLPIIGGTYIIKTSGNGAFLRGGDITVTVSTISYAIPLGESDSFGPYAFPSAVTHIAFISSAEGGQITFISVS